jgi:hypothetical protein
LSRLAKIGGHSISIEKCMTKLEIKGDLNIIKGKLKQKQANESGAD